MASITFSEFSELCRICGSKTSVLMGLHIFEREGNLRQIYKKITSCLPIQVHNSDKLPKMVCEECVYKLDLLFDFRENSIKTEDILKEFLKELTEVENRKNINNSAIPVALTVSTLNVNVNENIEETAAVQTLLITEQNLKQELLIKVEEVASLAANTNGIQDVVSSTEENNLTVQASHEMDSESDCDSGSEEDIGSAGVDADSSLTEAIDSTEVHVSTEHRIESSLHHKDADKPNELPVTSEFLVQENDEQTSWFFCNICGKAFVNRDEFNVHYEVHWNKCSSCGAVFTNEDALNAHRKEMHPSTTKPLPKSSNVKEELLHEQDLEKAKKKVESKKNDSKPVEMKSCPECGKQYRTNYKLSEHMRKHTGEKPYKCSTCEKAFRSKIGLAQHEAKHTGMFDYTCNSCGKGFQCKSYLIVHQRVHSDLKPYPCTTCGRNFKTKQSLLDHQNRHLGVKPYLCETCGRGFITKGLCKSHQRVHSGTDNRQYPCTVCHKLFVSKSYLATHLRIHTGEKPFMCEVCGKGFLTRVDLRIHSTMHTGEKSFVCEVCGKAFARRDALRCHRRSHTGERPYRCDICGQSFTQFSPMAIHKRLHTGERPYECDICGKTFVSRSTMMSHRKKHVNRSSLNFTPPTFLAVPSVGDEQTPTEDFSQNFITAEVQTFASVVLEEPQQTSLK